MDTGPLIIIIIAAVVIALIAVIVVQRERSRKLRRRFGPEYDRLVMQEHGRARRAEAILEERQKRIQKLRLRHLTPAECDQFTTEWRLIQEHFVDDPSRALTRAEALVSQALRTRGYPMTDYPQACDDISVEMPRAAAEYRSAREIVERDAHGNATTEELRRAMQMYREIFESAIETNLQQPMEVHR